MRLDLAVREFLKLLRGSDIAIFSNEILCNVASNYDRYNNYYIRGTKLAIPISLGFALFSKARVFVCITDDVLQDSLESLICGGLDDLKNLNIIVFRTNPNLLLNRLTVFNSMVKGFGFFHMDFTPYFDKVASVKRLKGLINVLKGPTICTIDLKPYKLDKLKDIPYNRVYGIIDD